MGEVGMEKKENSAHNCQIKKNFPHRKPCSCFFRYSEWSKKLFNCGISIFCPLTRIPPPLLLCVFTRLLLLPRSFVAFEWCTVELFDIRGLLLSSGLDDAVAGSMWAESLVTFESASDLFDNDNFSVVNSRKLLGELVVASRRFSWVSLKVLLLWRCSCSEDDDFVATWWLVLTLILDTLLLWCWGVLVGWLLSVKKKKKVNLEKENLSHSIQKILKKLFRSSWMRFHSHCTCLKWGATGLFSAPLHLGEEKIY